jgi:hypothetical protein
MKTPSGYLLKALVMHEKQGLFHLHWHRSYACHIQAMHPS